MCRAIIVIGEINNLRKKIFGILSILAVAFAFASTPVYAATTTAKVVVRDITTSTDVCVAVSPTSCTYNSLNPAHFYTITMSNNAGSNMSHVTLIGGHNANLWVSSGWYVNWNTAEPSCTYTATGTAWNVICDSGSANNIISVTLYGYPNSSATDDWGRGIGDRTDTAQSAVDYFYQTP